MAFKIDWGSVLNDITDLVRYGSNSAKEYHFSKAEDDRKIQEEMKAKLEKAALEAEKKNRESQLHDQKVTGNEISIMEKLKKLLTPDASASAELLNPLPGPDATYPKAALPPLTGDTKIFNSDYSATDSAQPIIQDILSKYQPKTPDVPVGWKTPLLDYVPQLASVTGQRGFDPRLLPIMGISETQALRPESVGAKTNNPFNAQVNGQNWQYPDIGTAINNYGAGIAGPIATDSAQRVPGVNRWSGFAKMGPDTTLRDYIHMFQNPEDDPTTQLNTILKLAAQLGY